MPQGQLSLCCVCTRWALPSAGPVRAPVRPPHQLRHRPGERQLEMPMEGQRRQQLLSHAGVWQRLWQLPAPWGRFCGWLRHRQAQPLPTPVLYQGDIPKCFSPQNTHRRTPPASKPPREPPYLVGSVRPVPSQPFYRSQRPNELRHRANPLGVWRGTAEGAWGLFLGLGCSGPLQPRGQLVARRVTVSPHAFTRVRVRAGGGRRDGIAVSRCRRLRAGDPPLRLLHGWGRALGSAAAGERCPWLREPPRKPRRHQSRGGGSSPGRAPSRRGRRRRQQQHLCAGGGSIPAWIRRLGPPRTPYKGCCPQPPAAPGPIARPARDDAAAGPGEPPAPHRGSGQPPPQTLPSHQYEAGLCTPGGAAPRPRAANSGGSAGFHGNGAGMGFAAY